VQNASLSSFGAADSTLGVHRQSVRDTAGAYLDLASSVKNAIANIVAMQVTMSEKRSQFDSLRARIDANPFLDPGQKDELRRFIDTSAYEVERSDLQMRGIFDPNFMAAGGMGTVTKATAFVAGEAGAEDFIFAPHSKGGIAAVMGQMGGQKEVHHHWHVQVTTMDQPSASTLLARAELLAGMTS
jgi:hypothetical protein